jgi:hypothetical protein
MVLEKAMENDLLSALKWFRVAYAESPANGPWNVYVRVYLFHVLKTVLHSVKKIWPKPKNVDQVQKLIVTCLGMEPLNEMVFTMMIDVGVWLSMHEGKMMLDSDNDGSVLEYFIISWEVFFCF